MLIFCRTSRRTFISLRTLLPTNCTRIVDRAKHRQEKQTMKAMKRMPPKCKLIAWIQKSVFL